MRFKQHVLSAILFLLLFPWVAGGQDFKIWEAKTTEFKQWLDLLKSDTYSYWLRLDSGQRPHRLYLGEGFHKADYSLKEQFVEIFSHYLAGHPEKYMLIDLFDDRTKTAIGEYGWGGFKLYPDYQPATKENRGDESAR